MTGDDLYDELGKLGGPRELDAGFRERLVESIADPAAPEGRLFGIDRPRPMPDGMAERLTKVILRPISPLGALGVVAATMAFLLIAGLALVRATQPPAVDLAIDPILGPESGFLEGPAPPAPPRPPGSLNYFLTAEEFLGFMNEQVELGFSTARSPSSVPAPAGASGQGSSAALPPASSTNVQVEGIDEPDIVKNNGRLIAFLDRYSSPDLVRLFTYEGGKVAPASSVNIQGGLEMFLVGNRLVHFSQIWDRGQRTIIRVIDVSSPGDPVTMSTLEITGSYVTARLVKGSIKLVIHSNALDHHDIEGSLYGEDQEIVLRRRRRLTPEEWLPRYTLVRPGRRTVRDHLHPWQGLLKPPEPSGLGLVTVLSIDPEDPSPEGAVSVLGTARNVYANERSLYVTSRPGGQLSDLDVRAPDTRITRIHRFDITHPIETKYVGSGEVRGSLLNQFAMSEYEDALRVASTDGSWSPDSSESFVTVLDTAGPRLDELGKVRGLGLGEQIWSVRFLGDKGYVVTFRRIDPLFVIDLSDPSRPRVAGELKILGVSQYLHPLTTDRLLGVGLSADEDGAVRGIQLSLFDVSDPTSPREQAREQVDGPGSWSTLVDDHRAFLYWDPSQLIAVPYSNWDQGSQRGVMLSRLRGSSFSDPLLITKEGTDWLPMRSLVIGERLIMVGSRGLLSYDLDSLQESQWVGF